MKELLIKLGLWEENCENAYLHIESNVVHVGKDWYLVALRHYCDPCNRWFGDTRGKLMHDRHRHK